MKKSHGVGADGLTAAERATGHSPPREQVQRPADLAREQPAADAGKTPPPRANLDSIG